MQVDLGSAKKVNKIYYENAHHLGGTTTSGAKNYTFWGSNDANFSDTNYSNDSNWTQIGGSYTFDIHVSLDQSDPKYQSITNTNAYRYYRFKIADNWGGTYIGLRRLELQDTTQPNGRTKVVLTNNESGLTSGKFPFATTNGRLTDSNLSFSNNTFVFSNDVNFDGNVWFNDSYWDDVSVSLTASGKPGSKPPTFDEADYAWHFEDQALAVNEQYIFGGFEMPHNWKLDTNISCHIHAHPETTNVGDYNFELSYSNTNINGIEVSPVVITLKQTTEGTANKVYLTEFPDIDMTGKTLSNTTEFRLKRLSASTTDTYTGDVAVDSFGCHYQIDAPGSRQKVVK